MGRTLSRIPTRTSAKGKKAQRNNVAKATAARSNKENRRPLSNAPVRRALPVHRSPADATKTAIASATDIAPTLPACSTSSPCAHAKLLADAEHELQLAKRRAKTAKNTHKKIRKKARAAEKAAQAAQAGAEKSVRDALHLMASKEADFQRQLHAAADRLENAHAEIRRHREVIGKQQENLVQLRRSVKNLTACYRRAQLARKRVSTQAHSRRMLSKMKLRRGYKLHIRHIARLLVASGCGTGKVGEVVKEIAGLFGVNLDRVMSQRTARRCVKEGLVIAQMQLALEMRLTEDITLSSDSTSRRKMNYQAHHVHLRAPEMKNDGSIGLTDKPKTRFAGVDTTVDHSSETSFEAWMSVFNGCSDTLNDSPLSKRLGLQLNLQDICRRLRGICGDHANGEKALGDRLESKKRDVLVEELGQKRLDRDTADIRAWMEEFVKQKVDDAGGPQAWAALSSGERAARDMATVKAMRKALGEIEFESLPADDKRRLSMWIWSGCCMHKDQNSFSGGNQEMRAEWAKLGVQGPVPLMNKFQVAAAEKEATEARKKASVLKRAAESEMARKTAESASATNGGGGKENELDAADAEMAKMIRDLLYPEEGGKPLDVEAAKRILDATSGGAKLTALIGAALNSSSDKRGAGDTHTQFMQEHLELFERIKRFPQTSNTRFGSHGEAACELIEHLELYRKFLKEIKMRKSRPGWTNLEKNIAAGLEDDATLTELAVMALYYLIICVPYMRKVRQPEEDALNALDLGPMHQDVRNHCNILIDKPELVLDFDADGYIFGSLDGEQYKRPEVLDQIRELTMMGRLPHLREIFQAFFRGALVTWTRFSSEYAPGGLIDGLTSDEKERAWRPATNDRNEGADTLCLYTHVKSPEICEF